MGLISRARDFLVRDQASRHRAEGDAPADASMAQSRPTGGEPDPDAPDTHSTTGTTESGSFVGRATGDDAGVDEKSGAEMRAEHERSQRSDAPDDTD